MNRTPLLRLLVAALTAGLLGLVTLASQPAAASATPMSDMELEVVRLHNEARAKEGLSPLTPHKLLMDNSRDWSRQMADRQKMEHQTPTNGYPHFSQDTCAPTGSWSYCGENIARSYRDALSVHTAWMNSTGHRANILRPGYNRIGVGVWRDSNGQLWWTARFMEGTTAATGDAEPHPQDTDTTQPNPTTTTTAPPPSSPPASSPPPTNPPAGANGPEKFVDAAYSLFVGRPATQTERSTWGQRIASGTPRTTFISQLATSDAWLGNEIDKVYVKALGRKSDPGGRNYWANLVRNGTRVTDVGVNVFASDEFYRSNGSTQTGFVRGLYRQILERNADQGGVDFWTRQMNHGMSRAQVASNFYASIESRQGRVEGLYRDILARASDRAGRDFWANELVRSDDVRLAAFLAGSDEYYARTSR